MPHALSVSEFCEMSFLYLNVYLRILKYLWNVENQNIN